MVIIVSALGFLMLGVLYVMKRGEVSRLKIDVVRAGWSLRIYLPHPPASDLS